MNGQDTPTRLPLIFEPSNRGLVPSTDARLVNCYVEFPRRDRSEAWVYQRPGFSIDSQPSGSAAAGLGLYVWKGDTYAIFGSTLYRNGSPVTGSVDTTNGVYRFSSTMGSTPKLQLGNGVKAYNYDTTNGLVQITDVDFPTTFNKGWAYLDGTTYVSTPAATIQGSGINDPTSWDPLNSLIAQIEPDGGVFLAKQLVYVILMKEWTTEVFYDAGNSTGSPLGRVEGAKMNYGCASPDSVQDIDGILVWLSRTRNGSLEVVLLDNLKLQVISNEAVERLLGGADASVVYSWVLKIEGHRFYIITFKNSNLTLAYDLDENLWSQWTYGASETYLPFVASCYTSSGATLVQHESDGRLYQVSSSYASDAGEDIIVDVVTPNFDGGVRYSKMVSRLEVVCDQQPGSEMLIRFNDSDYAADKWSTWRKVDLGQRRPYLVDCGSFYRRAYHLRHRSAVVRMPRLQAIDLHMSVGTT